ncbi:hypothetical protein OE88DRAFT_1636709 [Heliocybe sulcata]|uniref:MULE transposase domain-containing protein n=1 Tax=Heliocybe sulcata TaxID=5364 RepID=A0A5C3N0Q8_9AGAM|nr:hypothetical protein OE88DRAFT_1636709 [Heliocybe sulcata]
MRRYKCRGWLRITIFKVDTRLAHVHMTHDLAHTHVTDISLSSEILELIDEMRNQTASDIYDVILERYPKTQVSQKQVYARWSHINESLWRLHNDEVTSTRMLLEAIEGIVVENIPVVEVEGRSVIAYAFRDIVEGWAHKTAELALDSTFKTNAAGYELFAIIAEAHGQSLALGLLFTKGIGESEAGSKEKILVEVLTWYKQHAPNVKFTLSDKDTEINACRTVMPKAKHQLCYWHALKYVRERLSKNKPPAAYDPRKAHGVFGFIDPTWAPRVTRGEIEEYLDGRDVELHGERDGGVRESILKNREVRHMP